MYLIIFTICCIQCLTGTGVDPVIVYKWNYFQFDWPNATMQNQYESQGLYVRENIVLSGIKLFKDKIYVTVPRLKTGVPATLNVLMKNMDTSPLLRPYPQWEIHQPNDCENFLFVSSIEIDPNTGYMWILDTGFFPRNTITEIGETPCPAKLVIYDINNKKEVHRHIFPPLVVGRGRFYLKDLVLDFVDGVARFAYITDTLDWKLIVYDHGMNLSYFVSDRSMEPEYGVVNVTIAGQNENVQSLGINGIAMSPDFKHVYYSALAGTSIYRIQTSILRDYRLDNLYFTFNVKKVSRKISPGDGMLCSRNNDIYYSTLGPNAIYKWNINDKETNTESEEKPTKSPAFIVSEHIRMEWIDSMTIDDNRYLWFTSRNVDPVFHNNETDGNFYIWKVYVNDRSYLDFIKDTSPVQEASSHCSRTINLMLCLSIFIYFYFYFYL